MTVPCVTLFKNCSRNFDPSRNVAAMEGRWGGCERYEHGRWGEGGKRLFALYGHEEIRKKSSPELLVRNWNIFTRYVPCVTLIINCSRNFDPSKNMAAIGGDTDMKKFLKKFSCLKPLV